MVCNRCKTIIENELAQLGLPTIAVTLGQVEVEDTAPKEQLALLEANIKKHGFELLKDKNKQAIECIKNELIRIVYEEDYNLKYNVSEILSQKLRKDYASISTLFSTIEEITIEKYLIRLKIERVKELLVYDELTLSEIAFKLHYSSTAHLSRQFKKVTGLTPTFFKRLKENRRKSLDNI